MKNRKNFPFQISSIPQQSNYYIIITIIYKFSIFMWIGVAPVVPELMGDDDTSNFSPMEDPDAVSEGFDLTKVVKHFVLIFNCSLFWWEKVD